MTRIGSMIRTTETRYWPRMPLILIGLTAVFSAMSGAKAQGRTCSPIAHEGESYIVCQVDLRMHRLDLFWKDRKGEPYGSLSALNRQLQSEGQRPLFTMNAGMYHAELDPVGLYVQSGREFVRASTTNGPGNFHLKPNGVFYVTPEIATQSGPMLVINGKLHPRFPTEGVSRKVRNGVGVKDGDIAFFAISEGAVTFTDFARFFRDRLGTPNALFLDGSVSSLSAPGVDRTGFRSLGPMIGAFEKRQNAANPPAPR
jgi:uncharacterized protein YigE (DUF2233 family)